MPVYLQIILLVIAAIAFYLLALLAGGYGIRRLCFKIITEMEEAKAFSAATAIELPKDRRNFFRVGTGNLRPRALTILLAEGLVIGTAGGKYFLDQAKVADMKSRLRK
jgi:hypothetical protein